MNNNEKQILPSGFDEAFKILMTSYFGKFAEVITDFEIIDLPKRVDILIIETKKPIEKYVEIFKYFKRYNIIEFKSAHNPFRLREDFAMMFKYMGGILLNLEDANDKNTTFTIVSGKKPVKLLKQYKAKEKRQGLYNIENISPIPLYVAVADELELVFDKEIGIIKEFSNENKIDKYFRELIKQKHWGKKHEQLLRIGMTLYSKKIKKIINEEGIMNMAEKNVWNLVKALGIDKKIIEEGREQWMQKGLQQEFARSQKELEKHNIEIAAKLLARGLAIDEIADITGIKKTQIKRIKN